LAWSECIGMVVCGIVEELVASVVRMCTLDKNIVESALDETNNNQQDRAHLSKSQYR